jgi:hypothetical protein
MLKKILTRHPVQTVMGHRIPEPRLTWMALLWALVYLGLPVLLLGMLIDGLIQLATGVCTGLWCYF